MFLYLAGLRFRTEACDGHSPNPTSSRRASRRLGHGQYCESPVRRQPGEAFLQVEDNPRSKILDVISARWPLLAGTASTWLLMNMCGARTCCLMLPSMYVINKSRQGFPKEVHACPTLCGFRYQFRVQKAGNQPVNHAVTPMDSFYI